MKDRERHAQQETLFSLADKLVDAELAKGRGFTEGLTDWAIHEAKRILGI